MRLTWTWIWVVGLMFWTMTTTSISSASESGAPTTGPCDKNLADNYEIKSDRDTILNPQNSVEARKKAVEKIKDYGLENFWLASVQSNVTQCAAETLLRIIENIHLRSAAKVGDELVRVYQSKPDGAVELGWRNDTARDEILEDTVHVYLDLISLYHGNKVLSRSAFVEKTLGSLVGSGVAFPLAVTNPDLIKRTVARLNVISVQERLRYGYGLPHVANDADYAAKNLAASLIGSGHTIGSPVYRSTSKTAVCAGYAGCQ